MPSPVRTCIGCRGRADKAELLRLVWQDGPVADVRQRRPGRGAYLHRRSSCLELAVKRRALARALRLSDGSQVDAAAVREVVESQLNPSAEDPDGPTSRYRVPVA